MLFSSLLLSIFAAAECFLASVHASPVAVRSVELVTPTAHIDPSVLDVLAHSYPWSNQYQVLGVYNGQGDAAASADVDAQPDSRPLRFAQKRAPGVAMVGPVIATASSVRVDVPALATEQASFEDRPTVLQPGNSAIGLHDVDAIVVAESLEEASPAVEKQQSTDASAQAQVKVVSTVTLIGGGAHTKIAQRETNGAIDGTTSVVGDKLIQIAAGIDRTFGGRVRYECTKPGTVALTFNDGPDVYTTRLLDYLDRYDVPATFFINGVNRQDMREEHWGEIIKRICEPSSQHQLGLHGWTHRDLTGLGNTTAVKDEMTMLAREVNTLCGRVPRFVRPAFGSVNEEVVSVLTKEMQFELVNWNVETGDFEHPKDVNASLDAIGKALSAPGARRQGFMVLAHDPIQSTSEQLIRSAVRYIRKSGFELVTVAECLGEDRSSAYFDRGVNYGW